MSTEPGHASALMSPRTLALGVAGTSVTLMACVALPLLVYSLSLALFGLAHVLSELRYVDQRFSARMGRRLLGGMGALLGLVVVLRILRRTDMLEPGLWRVSELVVVAMLAALVLPWLRRTSPGLMVLGILVTVGLATGSLWAPTATFLLLAVVHNFTPVAFLGEVLPPGDRAPGLWVAGICFGGLPLLIATGLPWKAMAALGLIAPELTVLATGPVASHFQVYLPAVVHESPWALHAFSAAVFAQCMHYAAVIHVLPKLLPKSTSTEGPGSADEGLGARAGIMPWPSPRGFALGLVGVSLVMFALFALDFHDGRALYGIAAAVHAWVEIPILLVAFAPPVSAA